MTLEFYIMRNVIKFERKLAIDELTFVYNNSHAYTKREQRLKNRLIVMFSFMGLIVLASTVCNQVTNILDVNDLENYQDWCK